MEIKKISLQQNLRDDLIFDLFAPDQTKLIQRTTKTEELRRKFKRLWVREFAENIRCFRCDDSEITERAAKTAHAVREFVQLCNEKGEKEYAKKSLRVFLTPQEIQLEDGDFS